MRRKRGGIIETVPQSAAYVIDTPPCFFATTWDRLINGRRRWFIDNSSLPDGCRRASINGGWSCNVDVFYRSGDGGDVMSPLDH